MHVRTAISGRRGLTVAFIAVFAILSTAPISGSGGAESPDVEPAEDAPFLIITDDQGREVVLNSVPTRVLGLARQFMEELFVIGVTPVGKVDEYDNRPELNALPSAGSQNAINIEAILELEPDLILANIRQHSDLTDSLEAMGATVFFVDPSLEDDFFTDRVRLFGRLLDRNEEAEAYAADLAGVIEELRAQVAECGYETGIIVQGGSETIRAAQPTGLYGALFPALEIENIVPTDLPGAGRSTFVTYDLEAITQADPDIILIRAAGSGERDLNRLRQFYRESALWQGLRAVREDRLFVLPPRVNPGKISSEGALRTTADIICPAP
jgi:ABC-type Fe3+-hydroxamate transport system substrate-binding protein